MKDVSANYMHYKKALKVLSYIYEKKIFKMFSTIK